MRELKKRLNELLAYVRKQREWSEKNSSRMVARYYLDIEQQLEQVLACL